MPTGSCSLLLGCAQSALRCHRAGPCPTIAAAPGRVIRAFAGPAYGNQLTIDHGRDAGGRHLTTSYLHLQRRLVRVGDRVLRGQQIGTLTLRVPGRAHRTVRAVAAESVAQIGIMGRMWLGLRALIASPGAQS